MKKYISILLSICLLFLFSACGNEADLLKKIETLETENIRLKEKLDVLNEKYVNPPETYLVGHFQAGICDISYPNDEVSSAIAVIHLFQADPFIVYIDQEIAKTLEIDDAVYRFEIEPTLIDREKFPNPNELRHPEIAQPALFLRFKSIEKIHWGGNPCNFLRVVTRTEE